MASATNVVTLGLSPQLANLMAESSAAITAAGTTGADATACGTSSVFIMTASGSDGIRMNSATPLLRPIVVVNTSGSTGKIYPHTGGLVNGGATDAGESCATTTCQIWMRYSSTAWLAVLGA